MHLLCLCRMFPKKLFKAFNRLVNKLFFKCIKICMLESFTSDCFLIQCRSSRRKGLSIHDRFQHRYLCLGTTCTVTVFSCALFPDRSNLAQWLEHPTSVRKVVGLIPIWNSEFFSLLFSPHISFHLLFRSNLTSFCT